MHLFSQSRGRVAFDEATRRFLPGDNVQDCVSVGACNGTDGLSATIVEAFKAGELRHFAGRRVNYTALARVVSAQISGSLMSWAFHQEGTAASWIRRNLGIVLGPYQP